MTSYVGRALRWEEEKNNKTELKKSANEMKIKGENGKDTAVILTSIDVQKKNNVDIVQEAPLFNGSPSIFMEFPKVNNII